LTGTGATVLKNLDVQTTAVLHPVGYVRSAPKAIGDAPRQGGEGAPDAWLEVAERYEPALRGLAAGDDIILLT